MTSRTTFKVVSLAALFAVTAPSYAFAQTRGRGVAVSGHAVPRGSVRVVRPQIVGVVPYRPYYYRPYRPGFGLGLGFYGYPGYYYGGYGYQGYYGYPGYGGFGYGYPAYGYPGYGYSAYGSYNARPYGGVRIDLPQRDAQVFADGYFVGIVDQFDGTLQQLNLEAGPHHIEVRAPGFEPIAFEVNVEPGRTITYRAAMRPGQP